MMKSFGITVMATCLAAQVLAPHVLLAEECAVENRACVLRDLSSAADQIDNAAWRDQTYRELAKTLAFDGDIDAAILYIPKIQSADTKAMTIRGIGMAAADNKLSKETYHKIFASLKTEAEKIPDAPSYAIALTYIAMAQAFAGLDEEAWKTAASMENAALRHKAYGETAEIQAERGDWTFAMKSMDFITDPSYRDKEYVTVAKIFADKGSLSHALATAKRINAHYERSFALQYLLDAQKPREVEKK